MRKVFFKVYDYRLIHTPKTYNNPTVVIMAINIPAVHGNKKYQLRPFTTMNAQSTLQHHVDQETGV